MAVKLPIAQAPHHTQMSWASHWHARHDIADKILAAAQPETDETDSDDSEVDANGSVDDDQVRGLSAKKTRGPKPRKRRRKYEDSSDSSSDSESSSSSYRESDDDGLDVSTSEDKERMTQSGDLINRADIRMMARYIASTKNWEDISSKDRWSAFSDRVGLFCKVSCLDV